MTICLQQNLQINFGKENLILNLGIVIFMKNFIYFTKEFGYNALPDIYFKRKYKFLHQFEKKCDQEELNTRLDYYFKFTHRFEVPKEAVLIKDYKRKKNKGTVYFLDLKEFLHYFTPENRLCL